MAIASLLCIAGMDWSCGDAPCQPAASKEKFECRTSEKSFQRDGVVNTMEVLRLLPI